MSSSSLEVSKPSKKAAAPKKPRKTKPKPTAEEALKTLQNQQKELQQDIADLSGEYERVKPLNLEYVNEVLDDELTQMKGDLEEIEKNIANAK